MIDLKKLNQDFLKMAKSNYYTAQKNVINQLAQKIKQKLKILAILN